MRTVHAAWAFAAMAAALAAPAMAQSSTATTTTTVQSSAGIPVTSGTGVAVTPGVPIAPQPLIMGAVMTPSGTTTTMGAGPAGSTTTVTTYWVNVPANVEQCADFQRWRRLK